MIARLLRWLDLQKLKAFEEQLLVEIDVTATRRDRAFAKAEHSEAQANAAIWRMIETLRRTRAQIAMIEDPRTMLAEALARRTDIH